MRCQKHSGTSAKMRASVKMQLYQYIDCFGKGPRMLAMPSPKGEFVTTHVQDDTMLLHPRLAEDQWMLA